jgi:hypothetical protein
MAPTFKKSFYASNFLSTFSSFHLYISIGASKRVPLPLHLFSAERAGGATVAHRQHILYILSGGHDATQLTALSKALLRFSIPLIVVDPTPLTAIIAFSNCPRWILYPFPPASLG